MKKQIGLFYNTNFMMEKLLNSSDDNFEYVRVDDLTDHLKLGKICLLVIEEHERFEADRAGCIGFLRDKKRKCDVVVAGDNVSVRNVIRWMRNGASSYIEMNSLSKVTIQNVISEIEEDRSYEGEKQAVNSRVNLPLNADWKSLVDDNFYDMALVMIKVIFPEDSLGRYSKDSRDNILNGLRSEFEACAKRFGGIVWFWNSDTGVLAFHFDDYVNHSVMTAMYIMTHFFLICLDKIKLSEVLDIKISIHQGNCLFNRTKTEHVTTELINSLAHLEYIFGGDNNLYVTETVFERMSDRLRKYFSFVDKYEGKDIYKMLLNFRG